MKKLLFNTIICALVAQWFVQGSMQASVQGFAEEPASDLERLESVVAQAKKRAKPYNLPQHDFRKTNLDVVEPIDFFGSNFQGGNFSGTAEAPKIITNIDFSECNLQGANFSHAIITKCTFQKTQLNQANFTGSRIKFCSFREAFLEETNMSLTNQESVGYDGADLKKSIWNESTLFRVSFTRADERGWQRKDVQEKDCSHDYVKK